MTSTRKPVHTTSRRQGKKMNLAERNQAQEIFLDAFSNTANIRASCLAAGIDRHSFYQWREFDTDFSMRFEQAEQDANDVIRAEYLRRAVQGVDEPVVSAGKIVYESDGQLLTIKKYSDALLASLAKVRLPEFKETKEQVSPDQELSSAYDLREFLAACTPEELAVVIPITKAVAARKAEQDEKVKPIRMIR